MPRCSVCGGHVSRDYARVLADDDGNVRCPGCKPHAWIWKPSVIGEASTTYRGDTV